MSPQRPSAPRENEDAAWETGACGDEAGAGGSNAGSGTQFPCGTLDRAASADRTDARK
jgi:hypothetical protein